MVSEETKTSFKPLPPNKSRVGQVAHHSGTAANKDTLLNVPGIINSAGDAESSS
jgi:hypothetical protein